MITAYTVEVTEGSLVRRFEECSILRSRVKTTSLFRLGINPRLSTWKPLSGLQSASPKDFHGLRSGFSRVEQRTKTEVIFTQVLSGLAL
jgi:hypothetical protein